MFGRWYFDPRFCPVVLSVQFASVFISVYTLVAIGIDRYAVFNKPVSFNLNMKQVNSLSSGHSVSTCL